MSNQTKHNLNTSAGGRGYVADLFKERLGTHSYDRYINEHLAADFACALSAWLAPVLAKVDLFAQTQATPAEQVQAALYEARQERNVLIARNDAISAVLEDVPVVLPSCSAKLTMSHDWDQGYADGWSASVDEITKLGPLYPQATVEKLHFDLCDLRDGMRYRNSLVGRLEQERNTLRTVLDDQVTLLRLAREFVRNGVELGYICMPETDTPDPAHELMPKLEAALRQADGRTQALQGSGWADFLTARKHLIFASVAEGKSFEQIAVDLSLQDAAHAERIYEATKPVCEHDWVEHDEREAFEIAYCEYFNALPGVTMACTPEKMRESREGNHYGNGSNGKNLRWEGWQMRAAAVKKVAP